MKVLNSMAFVRWACPLLIAFAISACSEDEKSAPLPDLPPIELPKDVPGLYSGSMPCDDCTAKMIRMTLNADSTADVVQTIVRDSMKVDSLKGFFVVSDSTLKVVLPVAPGSSDSSHWNYKRSKSGNLTYLNSAGAVYEDKDGNRAELIRIFKVPVVKTKEQ